jgi:hypothetical protein
MSTPTFPDGTIDQLIRQSSPGVLTGTTDIDDSAQTETTPWTILTVAAPARGGLHDVEVWIDLAKATTGYAAVESSATIQLAAARQVDGTNWRREAYVEAALSGTNAANRMQKIPVGSIPAGQSVRIMAVMSADATSDMELPYQVIYRGELPTVTAVAAG